MTLGFINCRWRAVLDRSLQLWFRAQTRNRAAKSGAGLLSIIRAIRLALGAGQPIRRLGDW
jgi:hypothetical protein